MLLHAKQLVTTIEGMAKLLATSVTAKGFGPRGEFEDEGVRRDPVALVLEKLTLNLLEKPRAGCTREEVTPRDEGVDVVMARTADNRRDDERTCGGPCQGIENLA